MDAVAWSVQRREKWLIKTLRSCISDFKQMAVRGANIRIKNRGKCRVRTVRTLISAIGKKQIVKNEFYNRNA